MASSDLIKSLSKRVRWMSELIYSLLGLRDLRSISCSTR